MPDDNQEKRTPEDTEKRDPYDEEYGWKFHRVPLLIAVILTILFYGLIFIFVDKNPRW